MATEIRLPDVGEGVADVTINRWRVNVGEAVTAGDVILEVATDKVDTEIQAPASGVLLKINFRAGELAPVTAVMGHIGQAGESVDGAVREAAAPAAEATTEEAPSPKAPAAQQMSPPVAEKAQASRPRRSPSASPPTRASIWRASPAPGRAGRSPSRTC